MKQPSEYGETRSPRTRPRVRAARSRREFLELSAACMAGVAAGVVTGLTASARTARALSRGNALPGRIVLYHDSSMGGHLATIDSDRVAHAVLHAVRILAGSSDAGAAFESLFPGVTTGSTFAIKPNCLSWNDSRWEVVRGVVYGLSLMLGGSYDVSRITIYDVQCNLFDHGYSYERFTFNGRHPQIVNGNNCGGYYIYGSHRLSDYITAADYVINVPVLKAHNVGYPAHEITTAFKNHYGSLCPQSLCNNIAGMLTANSDPHIRNKTGLILTSGVRGVYQGGPWEPPQEWITFPDPSPNLICATTDPVTEAYWAREFINDERIARGWSPFACSWVEQAAQPPYTLGVSDPAAMTAIHYDPVAVHEEPDAIEDGTFLAGCGPNPLTRQTTVRWRLGRDAEMRLEIVGVDGRIVRTVVADRRAAGFGSAVWDGCDGGGRRVAAGTYWIRMRTEAGSVARPLQVID